MIRNRFYYFIKPMVPVSMRLGVRRWFATRKRPSVAGIWPIERGSERVPPGWAGWPGWNYLHTLYATLMARLERWPGGLPGLTPSRPSLPGFLVPRGSYGGWISILPFPIAFLGWRLGVP